MDVARLMSQEETGNAWSYARDRRVAAWARDRGIPWEEQPQFGVVRRLPTRDGWAARRETVMRQPQVAAPRGLLGTGETPGAIPSAAELRLAPDPCPDRQAGGRAMGLSLMGSFLTDRGQEYRGAMSAPGPGAIACSRLSPHLAFGTLSEREVVQAGQVARRRSQARGPVGSGR